VYFCVFYPNEKKIWLAFSLSTETGIKESPIWGDGSFILDVSLCEVTIETWVFLFLNGEKMIKNKRFSNNLV
jgi:hypothetical protein